MKNKPFSRNPLVILLRVTLEVLFYASLIGGIMILFQPEQAVPFQIKHVLSPELRVKEEVTYLSLPVVLDVHWANYTLRLRDPRLWQQPFFWVLTAARLVHLAGIPVIFWWLRLIVKSLAHDEVFSLINFRRLRWMSLTLITLSVAEVLADWAGHELLERAILQSPQTQLYFNWFGIALNYLAEMPMAYLGFILLVLAEIFRLGFQLKQEHDLTV